MLLVAAVLAFGVLAPPEHCPDVTTARARGESRPAAVEWFTRNQNDDGTWLYEYDAVTDATGSPYNVVRHAGAVMGLYQAATAGIPVRWRAPTAASTGSREHLVERDGWTAVSFDDGHRRRHGGAAHRRPRRAAVAHRRDRLTTT